MIRLQHLGLNNFLSHVSTDLPMCNYRGLVLIEGVNQSGHYSSNGSGKSSLLEGIVYALTGDTLRGVGVNDVVNRNHKKNTKVSLQFTKGDHQYMITRHRKDETFGDSLMLFKDGENISKRVNKETQKTIEDILGISYKILSSTMLLGEGLSSRFTQLSDPEKKSLIESTLSLDYNISTIRTRANQQLSKLTLERAELDGKLCMLRELSSLDVEEAKRQVSSYESEEVKATAELEELQATQASLKSGYDALNKKLSVLRESLQQYEYLEGNISKLQAEYVGYMNELEFSAKADIPVCTVCHQHLVSDESRQAFRDSYQAKMNVVNMQIADMQKKMSELPDKALIETTYQVIYDKIEEVSKSMEKASAQLSEAASRKWSVHAQVEKLRDSILKYEKSMVDMDQLEQDMDRVSHEIEKYEYFYQLFSPTGIIVNILSEAIEYINERLSTYSSVLLEKDYRINFVKGKISLVDTKGASYQSLSNGEKRRLDISIQFALHDYVMMYCGMKMDTCFIDEILDTLDDVGVENIFDVLRLKLEYCKLKSIYVITHNDALKNKFDQVITVRKDATGDSFVS